jgi:hypothetical protein
MPHDARERLIERGDWIKTGGFSSAEKPVIAQVHGITPGTDTCNVQATWLVPGGTSGSYFTASETTLVLKANGDDPEEGVDPAEVAAEDSAAQV